uniref:AB hydrolase-1 domain-containing protein n=1 Tax=Astyanax mexicanus TaxID=7994 RepID=A0A8B9HCJ8_ASTMX
MFKAVFFGLWGGVVTPHPLLAFRKVENALKLPRDFILNTILKAGSEGAVFRADRGKLTLTQMFPELEAECQKEAASQGLSLPAHFSAQKLFDEVVQVEFNGPLLDAAATLQRQGIRTCVLANMWIDDSPQRDSIAKILHVLENRFDLVVRSSQIGAKLPEAAVFQSALDQLHVKPKEMFKLLVMFCHFLQLTVEQLPRACDPEKVSHGYVTVKPGVKIHYVEMGDGPPVLLCHGFPESWYSWRYQIPALADAGFRVIAPDMKGYGDSSAPAGQSVTLFGHDWGGSVAWNMAQCHPERLRAVASLNTPLFPVDPDTNPMERLKAMPIFDYQIYFQEPGVAEAELERNLARTFKLMFTASSEKVGLIFDMRGLFVGSPEDVPRSSMLSEEDLQYYMQQFSKSGFRGPLNWYRNVERNWRWLCSRPRGKILMPALMVTAGKDKVLLPSFSTGMENMIPNLTRGHIEECGHWTQMERYVKICVCSSVNV